MRSLLTALFALHAACGLASDTWIALTPAEARMGSSVLASDPFAPETLYADAFSINSIGKSTDGGKTWRVLPFSSHDLLRAIVVERSAANRVTALTWDDPDISIHRSTDGGTTWTSRHFSPPVVGIVWDIAVDPRDTNTLYLAHGRSCLDVNHCVRDSGGISKSIDGGRHWSALFKDLDVQQILIDPFESRTIYEGSPYLTWRRSPNGGLTWTNLNAPGGESIFHAVLDPVVPDVLYASTAEGGFWRSDDRGDTWLFLGRPFSFQLAWTIAINPIQRSTIVIGAGSSQGTMRSTDGGRTWSPLNDGLVGFSLAPSQLAMVRVLFAADGRLYGAADLGGAMMLQTPPPSRGRSVRH